MCVDQENSGSQTTYLDGKNNWYHASLLSLHANTWFKYREIESFQICERLEMRRRGRGGSSPSPSPTPPPPPSPNCKLEAGVKGINSALCSAMFGLVLSDQAYREFQARQGGHEKVNPSSVFSFLSRDGSFKNENLFWVAWSYHHKSKIWGFSSAIDYISLTENETSTFVALFW